MLKYKCDYSYTARNYGVSTIGKQISILQPFARQLSVIEEYRLNEIKRKDKMQASLRPNYIGFYHRKDYVFKQNNLIGYKFGELKKISSLSNTTEEYRLNEIKWKDKMQASLRPNYIGFYHRKDYCNLNENLQTITMTVSNYEPRCVNNTYIIINLKIK